MLVSLSDSRPSTSPTVAVRSPPALAVATESVATLGDLLALASALFYALYVTLLKVRIKSESRIDMQLFFGFVGLVNVLACWPIGLLLHLAGFEVFEIPPTRKAWQTILVNVCQLSFFCAGKPMNLTLYRWRSHFRAITCMSWPC